MSRTDPYTGLRPRRLAPFCMLVSVLGTAAGIVSADDPRYGPWYLLAGPGAYLMMQVIFRISTVLEGRAARPTDWLFIP